MREPTRPATPPPSFLHAYQQTGAASEGLIRLSAEFDSAAFSPSLFEQCSLYCPDNIADSITKRQAEFFAGRWLASQALVQFGHQNFTVLADEKRCPLWPAGTVGSITHSDNQVRCAIGRASLYQTLGIDIQPSLSEAAAQKLQRRILSPSEVQLLASSALPFAVGVALSFSAKESIYKALYPIVKRYFGFACARLVATEACAQTLRFTIDDELSCLPGCPREVSVRYEYTQEFVYTEAALSR